MKLFGWDVGTRSLNIDLQQALNPPGEARVERFGSTYGVCDKVMQVENDYDKEVYNGDLGVVRAIDAEAAEMVLEFDGREITYGFGELDEIVLAYATTIHKSQGSEYPAVVIPLTTQHYPMLQRNLPRRTTARSVAHPDRSISTARPSTSPWRTKCWPIAAQ
jgi:exodeoxyribonuclease V alpha subunit